MADTVPPYTDMFWVTLKALEVLGGSASIAELDDEVTSKADWSAKVLTILHKGGPTTEVEYRLAWARTHLKGMGLISNSARGIWSITEAGRSVHEHQIRDLHVTLVAETRRQRLERRFAAVNADSPQLAAATDDLPEDTPESTWKETLLVHLMSMDPTSFEWLSQRLLREAGFVSATVTGRTGDGGIDGLGVYRLSLVSFQVFFQCKRYKGSVGAPAVRDFRGAMAGRGDKGMLITTGTFTADARKEATRDGAPPVDLIDGDRLCDLLKEFSLGVRTTVRTVEDVVVDPAFFAKHWPAGA